MRRFRVHVVSYVMGKSETSKSHNQAHYYVQLLLRPKPRSNDQNTFVALDRHYSMIGDNWRSMGL